MKEADSVLQGKFLRMTFSGRAYDDPCFATPMRYFDLKQLLQTPHLECTSYDLVSKNETKGIRWKYLYQSAVNAWNKLEYDKQKDSRINEKTMKPIPEKLLEPEDSSSSDNLSDDEDEELQASGTVQN
ncbi:hypothetical protein BU23DRAFT_553627 [Bimuria novae-zelandiae CBS 107.79]|uniref:Uncharacterized protein n=1 Tax=Bimuria novae-zelandiae CBS 107.79 TaxID=1447943 RepID=A0A6A5VDB8_9PLEO|nr:hypothetical protein BU23DRAFT_553627 [Bimuria novae-zelandiae CBS 107.79]